MPRILLYYHIKIFQFAQKNKALRALGDFGVSNFRDFCDILLQYRIIISFVCLYEIMGCFIQSLNYHEK